MVRYRTAIYRAIRCNNATYNTVRYFYLWMAISLPSPTRTVFISFSGHKLHLNFCLVQNGTFLLRCKPSQPPQKAEGEAIPYTFSNALPETSVPNLLSPIRTKRLSRNSQLSSSLLICPASLSHIPRSLVSVLQPKISDLDQFFCNTINNYAK
jgi:hypothetical protein